MTDIQLTKPIFIKVKDIERGTNGYNVIVKVLKAERKDVETRDGKNIPMVQAKVGDETGCSDAFFKGNDVANITEGKVIAIRNGVKRLLKGHISLQIDAWGRVTLEKNDVKASQQYNISSKEITFERGDRGNRRGNNRQGGNFRNNRENRDGDRGYNRGPNQNRNQKDRDERPARREGRDRNEQKQRGDINGRNDRNERPQRNGRNQGNNRGDRRPPRRERDADFDRRPRENDRANYQQRPKYERKQQDRGVSKFFKINKIQPGDENFNLIARVISCEPVKGKRPMVRCLLGDSTGLVNAFLPDSPQLSIGNSVCIFDAQARVNREHIELQTRNEEKIHKAKRQVNDIDESVNISDKSWVPVD